MASVPRKRDPHAASVSSHERSQQHAIHLAFYLIDLALSVIDLALELIDLALSLIHLTLDLINLALSLSLSRSVPELRWFRLSWLVMPAVHAPNHELSGLVSI